VNGNPTVTVDTIVERVLLDPVGFLERMLQEALDQLARDGTFAANGDRPPEELVATALGRHLGRAIRDETTLDEPSTFETSSVDGPATDPSGRALIDVVVIDDYEQLVERNGELAAAVGACDCWGQHPECPICEGEGAPGWVPPEKKPFTTYVYPAVRAVSRRRRPTGDQTEVAEQWKES
jgi:hypothetical protein